MLAELESQLPAFLFSPMFQTVTFYYTHTRCAPTTCIKHCVNTGNTVGNKKAVSSDLWGFHSSRGKSMCPDTQGVCFSCQKAWREPSLFKHSNPSVVCQFPLYLQSSEGSTLICRGRSSGTQRIQGPSPTHHPHEQIHTKHGNSNQRSRKQKELLKLSAYAT